MVTKSRLTTYVTLLNLTLMICVVVFVLAIGWGEGWLRFGPHDDLVFGKIKIRTWGSYIGLLVFICFVRFLEVSVNEYLFPIFWVLIYDRQCITKDDEFTTKEINFKYVFNNFLSGIRAIFSWVIVVTQFDLAIFQLVAEQICSFIVVHYVLSKKTPKKQTICNDRKADYFQIKLP